MENKEKKFKRENEYVPSKGENVWKSVGGVFHSLLKFGATVFCVSFIGYAGSAIGADIVRNKNKKKNYGK